MILGIETSCDETALALFDPSRGLAGEWMHSQVSLHREYGGVVPDLASREHLQNLGPLLELAGKQCVWSDVDRIAVTRGPGLAACLALGIAAAKGLSLAWGVPVCGVNHLRGHAYSVFLPLHAAGPASFGERWRELLPHLGLLVSGGNTLLFEIDEEGRLRQLASTRDDAAGEALDKGAKLLGLGYPGGPQIEAQARAGRRNAFEFPLGISRRDSLEFSFSGVKTSLRYRLEKMDEGSVPAQRPDLCASYQEAILQALERKTAQALADGRYASLGLSGGVSNNLELRSRLADLAREAGISYWPAEPRHTGDNAAMIAFAAWLDPALAQEAPSAAVDLAPSLGLEET